MRFIFVMRTMMDNRDQNVLTRTFNLNCNLKRYQQVLHLLQVFTALNKQDLPEGQLLDKYTGGEVVKKKKAGVEQQKQKK